MPQPNRFVTARISFRKGSTQEWEQNDPILMAGEPAYNTTLKKLKLGDGTSKWSELSYLEALGGTEWSNDQSGLFPDFIETADQAIDYVKMHHDLLEDNALAYFQAGLDGDPYLALYDLSVRANTGGSVSITGSTKDFNVHQEGDEVEISATSVPPYTFAGWTGLLAGEADTATTIITISEARNLVATFTASAGDSEDINESDPDSDGDGVVDSQDAFPNDPNESVDTDGDGVGDNSDALPNDPNISSNDPLYTYVEGDGFYWPVYLSSEGLTDFHTHELNGKTYYMPNSASSGVSGEDYGHGTDAYPPSSLGLAPSYYSDDLPADSDQDGIPDNSDPDSVDSDGDGVVDSQDAFPNDNTETTDTDGDGVGDNADAFPNDPNETIDSDGDGIGDNSDPDLVDTDGDGVVDSQDAFPNDPNETTDSDGDGVGDNADAFPNNAGETTDSDGDGVGDNADAFPNDPTESVDTDGDGVGDNADAFPSDPNESVDTDGDGVGDNTDVAPNDPNLSVDADGDGIDDSVDPDFVDSDGDGVVDSQDAFPNDNTETTDSDGDGVGDNTDAFPNDPTESVDTDGDGVGDNADAFPNDPSETTDTDGDGVGDNADAFPNDSSETVDTDGDGVGDNTDVAPNDPNLSVDADGDGIDDSVDPDFVDSDGDGVVDSQDAFPNDPTESVDTDGDGVGDNADQFPEDPSQTTIPEGSTGYTETFSDISPATYGGTKELKMIYCEPGTFVMGQDGVFQAYPVHSVTLTKGFYLSKYEVTQAQYESVMTGNTSGLSATPSQHYLDPEPHPDRPVQRVSWNDVQVFLSRLNEQQADSLPVGWEYALPTEAQWEYACRAGTTTQYSWGDTITASDANYNHNSDGDRSTDVGSYPANPWGFFDMHGNVWEYTADAYYSYTSGAQTDPFNAGTSSSERVIRGGSYSNSGAHLRAALRYTATASSRYETSGFRVALVQTSVDTDSDGVVDAEDYFYDDNVETYTKAELEALAFDSTSAIAAWDRIKFISDGGTPEAYPGMIVGEFYLIGDAETNGWKVSGRDGAQVDSSGNILRVYSADRGTLWEKLAS